MDAYEKIIRTMRSEGSRNNPESIRLGRMASATSCKLGNIELDADDFYVSEHLTKKSLVELHASTTGSGGETHSHGVVDDSEYLQPLKAGDLVLVLKISEEKYVIIDRVVEV